MNYTHRKLFRASRRVNTTSYHNKIPTTDPIVGKRASQISTIAFNVVNTRLLLGQQENLSNISHSLFGVIYTCKLF